MDLFCKKNIIICYRNVTKFNVREEKMEKFMMGIAKVLARFEGNDVEKLGSPRLIRLLNKIMEWFVKSIHVFYVEVNHDCRPECVTDQFKFDWVDPKIKNEHLLLPEEWTGKRNTQIVAIELPFKLDAHDVLGLFRLLELRPATLIELVAFVKAYGSQYIERSKEMVALGTKITEALGYYDDVCVVHGQFLAGPSLTLKRFFSEWHGGTVFLAVPIQKASVEF